MIGLDWMAIFLWPTKLLVFKIRRLKNNNMTSLQLGPSKPPRFYMPKKPVLTEANLGKDDYAQLGSRFKASHVKLIVFWLAKKTQKCSDEAPNDAAKMNTIIFLCFSSPLIGPTSGLHPASHPVPRTGSSMCSRLAPGAFSGASTCATAVD